MGAEVVAGRGGKIWSWRSVGAECLQTVITRAMEDEDHIG